jgi:hypothetical protein
VTKVLTLDNMKISLNMLIQEAMKTQDIMEDSKVDLKSNVL